MNDLIWIGNTLYPRWFIFAAIAIIPVTILGIEITVSVVQLIRAYRK